jgi:protein-tyrosine phosphatase
MLRTSETDPIRVDFVDPAAHGLPGRLGLTFAPGKSGRGAYANWDRDLPKDLARLRDAYGTKLLVTLLEEFEMKRASISGLLAATRKAGMKSSWFPITDVSVPHHPEDAIPVVVEILERLTNGDTVVVHCMGGLGRSGTIAACVLAARGVAPERAVEVVRAARPGALETADQVAFVPHFQAAWLEVGSERGRGASPGR